MTNQIDQITRQTGFVPDVRTIDVRPTAMASTGRLARALTRQVAPGTWLEGSVNSLQPRAIYPVPGGVEIQVIAEGSLQLSVR